MLQRDYIQRLIREFMSALERMLEKKEITTLDFDYASPNGKNPIMKIAYFDALS